MTFRGPKLPHSSSPLESCTKKKNERTNISIIRMLKAIQRSLGHSKPCSPSIRPAGQHAAYSDDDLESNTSSLASSQSASTFYSALTHLSDTGDAFDRQSVTSNSDQDAAYLKDVSIREMVEDSHMLARLRQISLSLDRKGKFKESLELLNEYREAATHFLPQGHLNYLKILSYLVDHYISRKNFIMAETILVECCGQKERVLGLSAKGTIKSKIKLAAVFQLQGNLEMCESNLSDCLSACLDAPSPHVKLAIEVTQSLAYLYIQKRDFEEAESMVSVCIEMQPDNQSQSSSSMKTLLELILIRKDASNALKRLDQLPSHLKQSSLNPKTSHLDAAKSATRGTTLSSPPETATVVLDLPADRPSSPIAVKTQIQQSPSSTRTRPAYASTRPPKSVSLDQDVVMAWADYIQSHSIPRDAPSIPLAITIGIAVDAGFETHYKVAAFALAESRAKAAK